MRAAGGPRSVDLDVVVLASAALDATWRAAADRHGADPLDRRWAEAVAEAAVGGLARAGRPCTVALLAGPDRPLLGAEAATEQVTALRLAPSLHLVLLALPAPRSLLVIRAGRAALLASRPHPMLRVGVAVGGASGRRALELAARSLAVAVRSDDGVGPVLGDEPRP